MAYIQDIAGGKTESGIRHDCRFTVDNIDDADRLLWLWVEEASNAISDCFRDELERVVECVGYDGIHLLKERLSKFSKYETASLADCFEDTLDHVLEYEDDE